MKATSMQFLTTAIALFIGTTTAIQSKGFYLELKSSNATLNQQQLIACHTGAAIEQPCVLPKSEQGDKEVRTFYLNYTSAHPARGKLIWDLPYTGEGGKKGIESEPMTFDYDPGRNIAGLVFLPERAATDIAFDGDNMMYILDSTVETLEKPIYKNVRLYRWHMCTITEGDEFYYSLTWLLGTGEPSIPGCQAVGVKRVYVS